MPDVFVSYSRQDAAFVRGLVAALQERGKQVWIDTEGIRDAEVFPEALRAAVEGSDGFVFVISPDSVTSRFCDQEVAHALELNKRIVPVVCKQVPDEEVPEPIRVRNWIPIQEDGGLEPGVGRLVQALDTDLEWVKAHTRWLVKALDWEAKNRDSSLLLRGAELTTAERWLTESEAPGKDPTPTALQRDLIFASRTAAARRQRAVAGTSLVIAAISVALLVFALIARSQAVSERTTAKSRALAAQSENQLSIDPELAILLGIQAVHTRATPDALFALRGAIDGSALRLTLAAPGACPFRLGPGLAYDPADGSLAGGYCRGRVVVFDGRDGHVVRRLRLGPTGSGVAYSPTGSILAVGGIGGVLLSDGRSGASRGMLSVPSIGPASPNRPAEVNVVAFSRDGSRIAADNGPFGITVWSVGNHASRVIGPQLRPGSAGPTPVRGLAFTHDGRSLIVARDAGIAVYNLATGARTRSLAHTRPTDAIALSPDGSRLAVASVDATSGNGTVKLWNTRTWKPVSTVAQFDQVAPDALAFSPDGTRLAVGAFDGTAGVWSVRTAQQLVSFLGPRTAVVAISFSPDGREVATASSDGTTKVWRAGGPERDYLDTGALGVPTAALAPGQLIASIPSTPMAVRTWRLPDLTPGPALTVGGPSQQDLVQFSADGRLAAVPFAGHLDVWDVPGRRRIRTIPLPNGVNAVKFSPDGKRLAVLSFQSEIVDLATGRTTPLLAASPLGGAGPHRALGLAPGASGAGPPLGPVLSCPEGWRGASFTRAGSVLAGGTFCGDVQLWDAHTGRSLGWFSNGGQISQVAFAPSGQLAVSSWDSRITIWNVRTERTVRLLQGHTRGVTSVAYSPDGSLLASGSLDHTARVWNQSTGRVLRVLTHPSVVSTVAFSRDGGSLVTSDPTGAIRVWDACPACGKAPALLALARRSVTRQLSALERATFLNGL